MLAANNADSNLSEKKMEGEDGLRTLECLRGRLLAERAASRVAKEDAELMGNKLIELENQLRLEIKSKKKAEKKLNFLKKKLESLKINCVSENSELSISSDNPESSCSSSSIISSVVKNPEEDQILKPQFTDSDNHSIEEIYHNDLEITSSNQNHTSPSSEENSTPQNSDKYSIEEINHNALEITSSTSPSSEENSTHQNSANSNHNSDHKVDSLEKNCEPKSIQSCEDSNSNDNQSLKSSINGGNNESVEEEEDENVDNSLALVVVPPSLQTPSQKAELKIVNKSVAEVLDALRHAREKLQSSMERRRHMSKFGSIGTQIC